MKEVGINQRLSIINILLLTERKKNLHREKRNKYQVRIKLLNTIGNLDDKTLTPTPNKNPLE